MTADIRTAAQREADKRHPGTWQDEVLEAFTDGAVWAAARVTPTREQIAIALARRKEPDWEAVMGAMHIAAIQAEYFNADAILALLGGLAEGGSR